MAVPSGDQAGARSASFEDVSRCTTPPLASTVNRRVPPAGPRAKASSDPVGAHAGSLSASASLVICLTGAPGVGLVA